MARSGWKGSGIGMFPWLARVLAHQCGADSQSAASRLIGTRFGACPAAVPMGLPRPLPLLLLCSAAVLSAQQPPLFRADVNLVRVLATVKNQAGELVGALQKGDFTVFDNGARQEISVFERRTELPLSVALLVDTSGSTNKELKYEADSASRFLHALLSEGNLEDAVALYSFNYDVTVQHSFTHNYNSLEARLKTLQVNVNLVRVVATVKNRRDSGGRPP